MKIDNAGVIFPILWFMTAIYRRYTVEVFMLRSIYTLCTSLRSAEILAIYVICVVFTRQ